MKKITTANAIATTILMSLLLLSSCSKDDEGGSLMREDGQNGGKLVQQMVFTAVADDEDASAASNNNSQRTVIGNNAATTSKSVLWAEGDAISVFSYDGWNYAHSEFTLSSGQGETVGTFDGLASLANSYTAIYPYQDGAYFENNMVKGVFLPTVQNATEGSFDPKAALMIAVADEELNLPFRNICSYLTVTPKFDCTSIAVESQNKESLAGEVSVAYNGGNPLCTVTGGVTKVTLAGNIKSGTTYYIALLPVTLSNGFSVTYETSDGTVRKVSKSSRTLARHAYYDISASCPSVAPTSDKAVDLGLSVMWASRNIGATEAVENGDYFAWAEYAPKSTYTWNNYLYGDGSDHTPVQSAFVTKYNADDGQTQLASADDAATALWGSGWRTPTKEEWEELMEQCMWNYTLDYNGTGVAGYVVSRNNGEKAGNQIFLPCSFSGGNCGCYWSASLSDGASYSKAFELYMNQENTPSLPLSADYRYIGKTIRAVKQSNEHK